MQRVVDGDNLHVAVLSIMGVSHPAQEAMGLLVGHAQSAAFDAVEQALIRRDLDASAIGGPQPLRLFQISTQICDPVAQVATQNLRLRLG